MNNTKEPMHSTTVAVAVFTIDLVRVSVSSAKEK